MSVLPTETPRDRILAASVRVIGRDGYEQATVERIAEVAGVSADEVLEVVGDVDACTLEAFAWTTHHTLASVLEVFQGPGAWAERMCDAFVLVARLFVSNPDVVRLGVLEAPKLGPRATQRISATREAYTAFLSEGIRPNEVLMGPAVGEIVSGGVFQVLRGIAEEDRFDQIPAMLPDILRAVLAPYCDAEEIEAILAKRRVRDGI